MSELQIEFTNNTLVITDQGVERLADILRRDVRPSVWAIKWKLRDGSFIISFHASHKSARDFAAVQFGPAKQGPARLVEVSDTIYTCVQENDSCWAEIASFDDAKTYNGDTGCKNLWT